MAREGLPLIVLVYLTVIAGLLVGLLLDALWSTSGGRMRPPGRIEAGIVALLIGLALAGLLAVLRS